MNRKTLNQEIADVYSGAALPPEIRDRLVRIGELGRTALPIVHRRPSRVWFGLAACIIALLAGNLYFLANPESTAPQPTPASQHPLPNLVVARIHADWCRRSPNIAPLFVELSQEFGNQPVLFVTLDITDDEGRKAARALAADLGIESVNDQPFESGMLKLIDRRANKTLAVVTDRADVPTMEGALASALPRRP